MLTCFHLKRNESFPRQARGRPHRRFRVRPRLGRRPAPPINGRLINAASESCLEDPSWNTSAGTQMQISQCTTSASQLWTTHPNGTISNGHSNRCLSVKGNGAYDLTPATQAICSSAEISQRMKVVWTSFPSLSNGGYEIVNDHGMCLDNEYGNTASGNPVEWFQCNHSSAQDWYPG